MPNRPGIIWTKYELSLGLLGTNFNEIKENEFETVVSNMVVILSRRPCVKCLWPIYLSVTHAINRHTMQGDNTPGPLWQNRDVLLPFLAKPLIYSYINAMSHEWRLKSPAMRLHVNGFFRLTIHISQLPISGLLWGESIGDRWIHLTKGQ